MPEGEGEQEFPNQGNGAWGIPVQKTDADGNLVVDESGDPVMVGSGYFWLSFYDQSIDSPESFVFDTEIIAGGSVDGGNTLHVNQYDLMPVLVMGANETVEAPADDTAKPANAQKPATSLPQTGDVVEPATVALFLIAGICFLLAGCLRQIVSNSND